MKLMIKNLTHFITALLLVTVATVCMVIFACKGMWERAGIILVAVGIAIGGQFATGYAIPVKYNDDVIRYKGTEYKWSEVKVTLVITHERLSSSAFVINLVFSDHFLFGEEAKKSVYNGFWVSATISNLKTVTQHYQDRIAIVGRDGSSIDNIDKYFVYNQSRQIINDHNKKHFDNVKQENGLSVEED